MYVFPISYSSASTNSRVPRWKYSICVTACLFWQRTMKNKFHFTLESKLDLERKRRDMAVRRTKSDRVYKIVFLWNFKAFDTVVQVIGRCFDFFLKSEAKLSVSKTL